MKKFTFEKSINNEEGEKLKITYIGAIEDDTKDLSIFEEKINMILKLFSKTWLHAFQPNMKELVSILRTIFKDCEEKYLSLVCENRYSKEIIEYANYSLNIYKVEEKELKGYYQPHTGVNFNYFFDSDISESDNNQKAQDLLSGLIDYVYKLNKVEKMELDTETKILLEYYKAFYNEEPNFMAEDINFKFQAMLLILRNFGISVSNNYLNFSFNKKSGLNIPISLTLVHSIQSLFAFESFSDIDNSVVLDEKIKKAIKIIGSEITAACTTNAELENICNILAASKYELATEPTVEEIEQLSENSKCSASAVQSTAALNKKICLRLRSK